MNAHQASYQVVLKGFLALFIALSAFQNFGPTGLAARVEGSSLLEGDTGTQPLACSAGQTSVSKYCNLQVVLLIDDSGSMGANDPQQNRITGAKHLVDTLGMQYYSLASRIGNDNPDLPKIEIAVIHFTDKALTRADPKTAWIQINPKTRAVWEGEQRQAAYAEITQTGDLRPALGTHFVEPFESAAGLFTDANAGDCTRQAVLLFSDGTPEENKRIISGDELGKYFDDKLDPVVKGSLSTIEGIYVTGFKVSNRYWDAPATHWAQTVKFAGTGSDSDMNQVPYVQLMKGRDLIPTLASRMEEIATTLFALGQSQNSMDLTSYPGVPGGWIVELGGLKAGTESNIPFQFVDNDGQIVSLSSSSTNNQKWTVSVKEAGVDLPVKSAGDGFQVSWTPQSSGAYLFKVAANLVDASEKPILNCSGDWLVYVPPSGLDWEAAISMTVGPSKDPENNTITVPIKVNYEGQGVVEYPISWTTRVITKPGQEFTPPVHAVDEKKGLYELIIDPVNDARQIDVQVSADAKIDGRTIHMPAAPFTINLGRGGACLYTGPWNVWFWPLVILLALALIILLVFRFVYIRPKDEGYRETRAAFWTRTWNLLVLPLSILLILAILNPLWCYVIPLWLFLVAILALIIITLPFRFMPWERSGKSSTSWLVALLLMAVLLVVGSILFRISFWWLLLLVLLVGIVRWILLPILFPIPDQPALLSMVMLSPSCVPLSEVITLPIRLAGNGDWTSTLDWAPSVIAEPGSRPVPAAVNRINAERGEYELCIDPVLDAEWLDVRVSAKSKDQNLTIFAEATKIEICTPDDLKDLEGIGVAVERLLHANKIYTFKQLAASKWTEINDWLNTQTLNADSPVRGSSWGKMMNPKTWPQQAKLREKAKESGREKDWKSYFEYKAWLFDGIEADEYARPEDTGPRRDEALVWPREKDTISEADIDAAKERFAEKVRKGLRDSKANETNKPGAQGEQTETSK